MPKYLYRRPNSPNWWFEMTIPEDVRDRFGKRRVRKTTGTDSYKKATRIANRWAGDLWTEIEKARSPDWDYHNIKAGVLELRAKGLNSEELDDIALDVFYDEPEKYEAYERATNKIVVLKDHLEDYLKWCEGKGNSAKTIITKRALLSQFCSRFGQLDKVTDYEVRRWTSERDSKGSSQKSMRAFSRDFFKYLGEEVLFTGKLDVSVLDGLKTKSIDSKHKEVLSGDAFRAALKATTHKDAMMMLAYTGRRSVAVANLTCDDVVMSDGVSCFRFRIDKGRRPETHKPQLIPIHSKLQPVVDRLLKDSTDGYLLPLGGKTPDSRSSALQTQMRASGRVTSHQFRTSVVTMLHNSPVALPDKTIYSVVGHSLNKDEHMKSYMKGLKPSALVPTVEAIDWDNWEYE